MATRKSVLQNTFFQISGKIITVLCSLLVVKLITGVGQGFYGDYVTAYEFLAFFGIIADAGLFAIAVKEMSQTPESGTRNPDSGLRASNNCEYILGNILSIRLLLILLVCAISVIAAQFIPTYDVRVKQGIYITAASMGLTIVAGTLSSVLQARMKIQYFSGSLAFGKIILLGGILYLIEMKGPGNENQLFQALLYAGLISNIIFLGLVSFFVSRMVRITLRCDLDYWKETFKVSLPYGMALILQTLYLRLDILLISILLTSQATGIYGVCARVMESFLVIGVFFGQAMLPKLSKEGDEASSTLTWGIEKILLFALPILWGGYLFADNIILLLANQSFLSTPEAIGSDTILQILIPTVLFAYLNQLFTFTLVSKNRQNYLLIVNLIAVLFNGGLNWYFLPIYGIQAAAITTVTSEILVLTCLSKEIKQHFSPRLFTDNVKWILLVNFMLYSLFFLTPIRESLPLALGLGILSYGIFIHWRRNSLF